MKKNKLLISKPLQPHRELLLTKTQPKFDPQLLDALLAQYQQPVDLLGSGGILLAHI